MSCRWLSLALSSNKNVMAKVDPGIHRRQRGRALCVNADSWVTPVARRAVPAGLRAVLCRLVRTGAGAGGALLVPRPVLDLALSSCGTPSSRRSQAARPPGAALGTIDRL